MSGFTYTVFLVVASVIGSLVTLFAAGVIAALLHETRQPIEDSEPKELPRAA